MTAGLQGPQGLCDNYWGNHQPLPRVSWAYCPVCKVSEDVTPYFGSQDDPTWCRTCYDNGIQGGRRVVRSVPPGYLFLTVEEYV